MTANPALADLEPIIGAWRMEVFNGAFLPAPDARLTGLLSVEWIAEGAAIAMRQGLGGGPPAAVWIVGRDGDDPAYHVLYADARGVSRVYRLSLNGREWRMWRSDAAFSQRFAARIAPGGNAIDGAWEKSTDGGRTWEHDFNVTYVRVP